MSFINYRLCTSNQSSINIVYPPKLGLDKDDAGAGLAAYLIQSASEQVQAEQPPTETVPVKDTTKQLASLASKLASLANDPQTDSSETVIIHALDEDSLDIFTSAEPDTNLPRPPFSPSDNEWRSPENSIQPNRTPNGKMICSNSVKSEGY